MIEEWKITVESDRYEVSNLGNVRHIERKKNITTDKNHASNYCFWSRRENKKLHNAYVHRTVYQAFNEVIIPKGMEINHLDFNRKNNCLNNLELVSKRENNNYSDKAGRYNEARKKHSEWLKEKAKKGELDYFIKKTPEQLKSLGLKIAQTIKERGHHNTGKFGLDNPTFKWNSQQLKEVRELWKSGKSMKGIARLLNRPYTSIRNVCVGSHKNII